jgi:cbb3-type cytochrome oxidase cytochrome c subunit
MARETRAQQARQELDALQAKIDRYGAYSVEAAQQTRHCTTALLLIAYRNGPNWGGVLRLLCRM